MPAVSHHRLLHYPPLQNYTSEISAGAHIDYGLLTILATDAVSGLQVLNSKKNAWIHVPPREDGLVINFGHMLSEWTGGRAKATVHRVVNAHAGFVFSRLGLDVAATPLVRVPAWGHAQCSEAQLAAV